MAYRVVSNVCNPRNAVFHTGLLPALAPSVFAPHLGMTLLVLIHAALSPGPARQLRAGAGQARTFFEKPAVRRTLDRVAGFGLIGFGIEVATSQP